MIPRLTAGDTLDFATTVTDYPASAGWTLSFRLVPLTGSAITWDAIAEDDDYRTQQAPGTTAAWVPGEYAWSSYVHKTGARYTVDSGRTIIEPDPATMAVGTDTRTHARKVLLAIEAVLESRASIDQEEYSINGRSLKRTPIADLLRLRDRYKAMADAETAASSGLARPNKMQVRF